jgi:hypothetical protein
MTKDSSFKKVVRRHGEETGQRYTEALTDLEGLGARMNHEPVAERLLAHLRDRYGIDAVAATKLSVHKTYVFRIDRKDGEPWVARAFPPARRRANPVTPKGLAAQLMAPWWPLDDPIGGPTPKHRIERSSPICRASRRMGGDGLEPPTSSL